MTLSCRCDCDNDCKIRSEQRSLTACLCGLGATQNVYLTEYNIINSNKSGRECVLYTVN